MSYYTLSDGEKERLRLIMDDLRYIFELQEILPEEVDKVLQEVKSYINSPAQGAKPETALREVFFAGRSVLSRILKLHQR